MPKILEARVAINAEDAKRVASPLFIGMLLPRLGPEPLKVGQGEEALGFVCSMLEAALACDIIRSENRKAGETPCRVYIRAGAGWLLLRNDDMLTVAAGDDIVLAGVLLDSVSQSAGAGRRSVASTVGDEL